MVAKKNRAIFGTFLRSMGNRSIKSSNTRLVFSNVLALLNVLPLGTSAITFTATWLGPSPMEVTVKYRGRSIFGMRSVAPMAQM